jgi:hypothetical protein
MFVNVQQEKALAERSNTYICEWSKIAIIITIPEAMQVKNSKGKRL